MSLKEQDNWITAHSGRDAKQHHFLPRLSAHEESEGAYYLLNSTTEWFIRQEKSWIRKRFIDTISKEEFIYESQRISICKDL